jgi:2-phosphosulfolactate phosphatase
MKIDAILSPAELPALANRDLRDTTCVVFDVLRATSAFVTALHNGAKAIIPVSEIAEALALRQKQPDFLLGGERDGVRIRAAQTGGIDFDLGNSPREYTPEKVRGKTFVSTTTNGTRALRACAGAQTVLAASFLNLTATAQFIRRLQPAQIVLVCAGTRENMADEDVLAAGALCELLSDHSGMPDAPLAPSLSPFGRGEGVRPNDSAEIALRAYTRAKSNLAGAICRSENARRLLAIPELRDDVAFCLQQDVFDLVAVLGKDGIIRTLI